MSSVRTSPDHDLGDRERQTLDAVIALLGRAGSRRRQSSTATGGVFSLNLAVTTSSGIDTNRSYTSTE